MSIEEAVELTIEECIRDGILKEFLERNKAEAKTVSIYEYSEEEHMRMEREQHYEEGFSEGLSQGKMAGVIEIYREFHLSENEIVAKLMEKYNLSAEKAREVYSKN